MQTPAVWPQSAGVCHCQYDLMDASHALGDMHDVASSDKTLIVGLSDEDMTMHHQIMGV